jgi:hypothetical protein
MPVGAFFKVIRARGANWTERTLLRNLLKYTQMKILQDIIDVIFLVKSSLHSART